MPNNRGPSRACRRCRDLKVKCDEGRPSCYRCQKSTRECVYQSQFDLFHRDQNTVAQAAATKKWRQRSDTKSTTVSATDLIIPRGLGPALAEAAYNRLYYDFVLPWPATLSRLPKQMRETAPNSCFVSVVAAVAYANFHGRCYSPEAKRVSGVHYGQALQRLATAMADPVAMQRDEILMVIWLLGMYEMLSSRKRDGSWITHMRGTQSVIAHRDKKHLEDGDNYLAILCMNMVIYYLAESEPPPAHLRYWIQQILFPMDFKKQLVTIMAEAATACSNLRDQTTCRMLSHPELSQADLALVQEALAVDLKLQAWSHSLPPEWSLVSTHSITIDNRSSWSAKLLASPGAPEYATRYSNRLAAFDWNACRASQLSLHLEILSFVFQLSSPTIDLDGIKSHSLDMLVTLTNEIASSVPYALDISPDGSSDLASPDQVPGLWAYRIIWPMFTGLTCLQNDLVRKRDFARRAEWFRTILRFLRDTMGIAKVDVFLEENCEVVS